MENYKEKAKAYDEAIRKLRGMMPNWERLSYNGKTFLQDLIHIFPELKESEDERIRKEIIAILQYKYEKFSKDPKYCNAPQWIAWLEKQELKSNPYSGVSFSYNGNIWGMCARDNGVDILFNKKLIRHISGEKQAEQKPADKVEPLDEFAGLTDFERTLADVCIGWIGKEIGWKQYIKDNADVLLQIAVEKFNSVQDAPFERKFVWSEEDTFKVQRICKYLDEAKKYYADITEVRDCIDWLKNIKQRIGE